MLAEKQTRRRDPLDRFRHYTGGWNIRNKHYLSSVGFTAAPLLIIAAIWFLGFSICLCFICIRHFYLRRPPYGYSRLAYAMSLVFVLLSAISVLTGSIVLYTGQGRFHGTTKSTMKYVVGQADDTVTKLRNISNDFNSAKGIGVDQIFLPSDVQNSINNVVKKVDVSADTLQTETEHNSYKIRHSLHVMSMVLIVVAAIMFLFAVIGSALSVFGYQKLVSILVVAGWILVTVTFIWSCAFLVLHNLVGDSCVAMDEWVNNPTAETALDDILPCVENATARETLNQSKVVTSDLVGLINHYITNVANSNPRPGSPFYYNQSGPFVPLLCNPFQPDRSDRDCTSGEVSFSDASEEWKKYVCQVSDNVICTSVGRLRPETYKQMSTAVNTSDRLYLDGTFLVSLLDCSFVRDTFAEITRNYCTDMLLYSKWIYIGLLIVSTAVMLSLISWVVYARERQHRMYALRKEQFVALSEHDNSSSIVSKDS